MIMLKVLFALILISSASAFSFHLGARDRKCFSEEVHADTMVMGKYKVPVYKPNTFETHPAVSIFIEVRDSDKRLVMSDQYTNEGKFIFQARSTGEHEICTTSNASVWINLDVGKPAEKESNKIQETNDLQLRIFELRDLLNQVVAENNYQQNRKERMRQIIESTNTRVFLWAIIEFLLLVAMAAWQIHYLKRFFEIQRVNGGQPATVEQYPFLAQLSIQYPDTSTGRCSASIVAQQFVISAYHCIKKPEFNESYAIENTLVITGTNNAYNGGGDGVVHKVEKFYHKEFKGYDHILGELDLLIIKLTEPIEFNDIQSPIVLNGNESLKIHDSAIFAGIGPLPNTFADIFREGQTTVMNLSDIYYWYDESNVQSVQGDSGGPFFSQVDGQWILHGIIPGGNYVPRISYLCDWIKEVTDNELTC